MDESGWIAQARSQFLDLLQDEHAVVLPEVEAKLCDKRGGPYPHILTKARKQLADEGEVASTTERTRGGRAIPVWHLADLSGRERSFKDAAARKRLLFARYLSWNNARAGSPNGFIGPAGERVVHSSLIAAAPYGYRLAQPSGARVSRLLGRPVPTGPLDNAAFLQVLDADGVPAGQFVVPIEVKNIRHWIYPASNEPYQLLFKAAVLQAEHPDLAFIPVLVCRRRSFFIWEMGKELGFFPIEVAKQYIVPHSRIHQAGFEEVRSELGYTDLTMQDGEEPRLVKAFTESLPSQAVLYAERWKTRGSTLKEYYEDLRDNQDAGARSALLEDLRDEVRNMPDCDAKW